MPHIDKHLQWCMNDERRLVKIKPDIERAKKHIKKSEYDFEVLQDLESMQRHDWALNVGFYSIYHCFLAILAKHGYSSRNQSCTITVLLKLIEQGKIDLDKDLILQFDTLEPDTTSTTIRQSRETSTYGIETSIDLKQLEHVKELILKIQKETIKIIENAGR